MTSKQPGITVLKKKILWERVCQTVTTQLLWYTHYDFLGGAGAMHRVPLKRKPPYTMTEKVNSDAPLAQFPGSHEPGNYNSEGRPWWEWYPGHLSSPLLFAALVPSA